MNSKTSQISQEKQVHDTIDAILNRIDTFDTARLRISSWRPVIKDKPERTKLANDLTNMLTEPVLRHLPERVQLGHGPEAIQSWMDKRDSSAAIYLVRDDKGLAGLMFLFRPAEGPDNEPLHLGYLFGEASWGKGYATEMVIGLAEVLSDGPIMTLQGGVDVANPASARVLEKAGFVRNDAHCSDEVHIFARQVGLDQ